MKPLTLQLYKLCADITGLVGKVGSRWHKKQRKTNNLYYIKKKIKVVKSIAKFSTKINFDYFIEMQWRN